jgi:lipopolysaccharide export LptBFGC system permease protein LptF
MRRPAMMIAGLVCVAATGTGLAVGPAFSEPASHTLTFVSHNLDSLQTANNHVLQASEDEVAGVTVGFAASTCTDDFSTGVITCDIAAAGVPGMIYAHVSINTNNGQVTGKVTGGTDAYKAAKGTVRGQPGTQPGDTDITIVYHT